MGKEKRINCFSIAVRNLNAQMYRSLFMMFFVLLMSATFFFSNVLVENMRLGIKNTTERMGADIIVIPNKGTEDIRESLFSGTPCSVAISKDWVERLGKIEGVKRLSPQLYVATQAASCCDAAVQLIAFDPKTDFVVSPWLSEKQELNLEVGEVVVGYNVAAKIGQNIKFYNTEFKVAAKLDKSGMGYDNSVFMTFDTIYKLANSDIVSENLDKENLKNIASMIMIEVEDGVSVGSFGVDLQEAYPEEEEIYACTASDLMSGMAKEVEKLSGYGNLLIVLLVVSTALALINIFMLTINERKYEFGILYVLGAKRRQVFQIIISEAMIISLVGGFIGLIVAYFGIVVFGDVIRQKLEIQYMSMKLEQVGMTALICMGISFLTGILAAVSSVYRISKEEPYRLIMEKE